MFVRRRDEPLSMPAQILSLLPAGCQWAGRAHVVHSDGSCSFWRSSQLEVALGADGFQHFCDGLVSELGGGTGDSLGEEGWEARLQTALLSALAEAPAKQR